MVLGAGGVLTHFARMGPGVKTWPTEVGVRVAWGLHDVEVPASAVEPQSPVRACCRQARDVPPLDITLPATQDQPLGTIGYVASAGVTQRLGSSPSSSGSYRSRFACHVSVSSCEDAP